MIRTHVICSTGQIDFFNSICYESIQYLELAIKCTSEQTQYTFVAFNDAQLSCYETFVQKHRELNSKVTFNIVDLSNFASLTLLEIATKLINADKALFINTLTITVINGACVQSIDAELAYYTTWLKLAKTVQLKSHTQSKYEACMLAFYEMCEVCCRLNIGIIQVNNIIEDPMQCKLTAFQNYIDMQFKRGDLFAKIKCRHLFFHKHPYFEYAPFQEYAYVHGKQIAKHDKSKLFTFAMTNVWQHLKDRTTIIDALKQYQTTDADLNSQFIFRYTCKHIDRQDLIQSSNKLLPYDVYLRLIKQSYFTLIIPSYDTTTFSLRRFVESLMNGCIPLILDTCDMSWVTTNALPYEQLLVSIEDLADLKNVIKQRYLNRYNDILEELKLSPFITRLQNDDVYVDALKECKYISRQTVVQYT